MAKIAKRVTKKDIHAALNDKVLLDKLVTQYFKQDGFRLKEGKPELKYITVTTKHSCHLCKLRWTEKNKVAANVPIDPHLTLWHDTCSQCGTQLLHRSKEELAQLLIDMHTVGKYTRNGTPKGDITDLGSPVDPTKLVIEDS